MATNSIQTITPTAAQQKMEQGVTLIDVREYPEWQAVHVAKSTLIPLSIFNRKYEVGAGEVLLLCRSGKRATQAAQSIARKGGKPLVVEGGIIAWEAAGLVVEKTAKKYFSLERQMRITAGALVLIGLSVPVLRPVSYFVGAGLVFSGVTDWCGMTKILGLLPWNKVAKNSDACALKSLDKTTHG